MSLPATEPWWTGKGIIIVATTVPALLLFPHHRCHPHHCTFTLTLFVQTNLSYSEPINDFGPAHMFTCQTVDTRCTVKDIIFS